MGNLFRQIRDITGLSQAEFGRELLGRVHQSVQGYETGKTPPLDVVEKYEAIATAHGRADLAVNLKSDEWRHPVIEPGERVIGPDRMVPKAPTAGGDPQREYWHTMLDQILDSGQADAVDAIQSVLLVTADRVRLKRRKPEKKAL